MESTTDKGLSLRSDEVQEVMGGVPHWTMRWGLAIMALIVAAMGIGGYFFRLPEKTTVACTLSGSTLPCPLYVPCAGTLADLPVPTGTKVEAGTVVARLRTVRGDTLALTSPAAGTVHHSAPWTINESLATDTEILTIAPRHPGRPRCVADVPPAQVGKLQPGMTVRIRPEGYPEDVHGVIEGVIATLYPARDRCRIDIRLPHGAVTSEGTVIPLDRISPGTADIIVENKRLLLKLLGR